MSFFNVVDALRLLVFGTTSPSRSGYNLHLRPAGAPQVGLHPVGAIIDDQPGWQVRMPIDYSGY